MTRATDFAANQKAERKSVWQNPPGLVEGEPISPFQRAAILGGARNLVCNWGSHGGGYINADVTLNPRPTASRIATATPYDR